jgi:predicted nuclease of restriction endonuclease-like (RecB) superfamily
MINDLITFDSMKIQNTDKSEYHNWISELKSKIQSAQLKAAISVNKELLALYWEIGSSISVKITKSNWGNSIVEELSKDLKAAFPNQKGFSRSSLFSMKQLFDFYSSSAIEIEKVQQVVGQIPWGHNLVIITKSKSVEESMFYCNKTIENNWSRAVLIHQISSGLYSRQGKAITNFSNTLPLIQSELAVETLKDPYKLDFLDLQEKILEKDIEAQLIKLL